MEGFLLANESSTPGVRAKRQVLMDLSGALSVLSDRMRSQQANATKITVLAATAEKIAERSRNLSNLKIQEFQRAIPGLVAEVDAFARTAAEASMRAGQAALLGKEVAAAIAAHSTDIAKLGGEMDHLLDANAVRAYLRPLTATLSILPERLKANNAMIEDVTALAVSAGGLSERAAKLTGVGRYAFQAAVDMSRDLRDFAEKAASLSLGMAREAAGAVKAIDSMSKQTLGLATGQPAPDGTLTADNGLKSLLGDASSLVVHAPMSASPKRPFGVLPAKSMVWSTAPLRR